MALHSWIIVAILTSTTAPSATRSFAAFAYPAYRAQFAFYVMAMMADNIEHVISYWIMFQKFHSPALGGLRGAVALAAVPAVLGRSGALADRFDPRRIIQLGMLLFMRLARLGLLFLDRHAADVARDAAAGRARLRRRAVADPKPACCSTTSSGRRICRARSASTPPRAISACWSGRRSAASSCLSLGPTHGHLRQRAVLPAAAAVAVHGRRTSRHWPQPRRRRDARLRRHRGDAAYRSPAHRS